jgi:hypothetical protein
MGLAQSRFRPRVTPLARVGSVATAFAAVGVLALAGCRSDEAPSPGSKAARDAERTLFDDSSSHVRNSHPRCVEVGAPWAFVCTVQRIGFGRSHDEPLAAIGYTPAKQLEAGMATGLTPIPVDCATDVRCWVYELCRASSGCTGSPVETSYPDLGTNAPPEPITPEVCVDAWNVHGGFSAEELAREAPSRPDDEVTRPLYTPHLAAPTLGFLGPRADVRAVDGTCSVVFDLGDGTTYAVDATVDHAPRFWTWAGREATSMVAAEGHTWNACQEADGTLSFGDVCTGGPQASDVADELDRRVLHQVSEFGGIPYWLGPRFLGALPERSEPKNGKDTVEYTVETSDGPLELVVVTYRPPRPRVVAPGFEVFRARPASATVLVVANRRPSRRIVLAVRSELRPFRGSDPNAEQVPGDVLPEEPTRVDTSVRERVYWAGPTSAGLRAEVVENAGAGLGVVRYGAPGGPNTFYLVTYKPMKKTRCLSSGCVAPPAPPASFRRYGVHVNAAIYSDWIVEVLAPSKKYAEITGDALRALTRLR